MRHRLLRIVILAWTAWWFVGFIPAHQRGMIAIDASASASPIDSGGCGSGCAHGNGNGDSDTPGGPADDPSSNCGVCHLVAKLDLPAPFILHLAPLADADDTPPSDVLPLCSRHAEPHYLGRAPPFVQA